MESELMDAQLAYWKNQLAAPLPELQFQQGRRRNKRRRFENGHKAITVENDLFAAVKALAKSENCTPFMVVLAALNVALHVHTCQQDIRIGTLMANRRLRETENQIGYFVNAVVLRNRIKPVMTWKKLLKQVREVTLGAYAHQELPFGRLAHILEAEGNVKGNSLLPVLLNYQNVAFPTPDFAGLKFAVLDFQEAKLDSEMALTAVDLILDLRETPTKLTGSVNYKAEIFSERDLARLMQTFQKALETMVATPSQAICDALKGASARVKQLSC